MVLDLVVQMVAHGHECSVFYQKEVEEGMKVVDYPCEVRRLQSWDDLSGYDVVHTHGMGPEVLALKAKLKAKSFKFQLVTTLHCYCFQDFFDLYGKVKGSAMGVAYLLTKKVFDKVVCLSKDMMQYYERWIPKRKLAYAYNTRDICLANLTLSEDEHNMIKTFKGEATLIGMNCVLLYRKGIDVMLKALALISFSWVSVRGNIPKGSM